MSDAQVVKRLSSKIEQLEEELSSERGKRNELHAMFESENSRIKRELTVARRGLDAAVKDTLKYRGEITNLRELLEYTRAYLNAEIHSTIDNVYAKEMLSRIDAVLRGVENE